MISDNDINTALSDITGHDIFSSSPKACQLLEYIVKHSHEDPHPVINEIMIAQDVFGKDADFNPSQDSQVRVAVGRLRNMLALYYAQTENPDVIISIPTGRYVAKFEVPTPLAEPSPPPRSGFFLGKIHGLAFLLAGLLVFGLGYIYLSGPVAPGGGVASVPEQNLSSETQDVSGYPRIAVPLFDVIVDNEDYAFLEKALQWKLVEDLSRFEVVRPEAFDGTSAEILASHSGDFDYILVPIVLKMEPELDLSVKLVEVSSGATLYENRVQRTVGSGEYFDGLTDILDIIGGEFFVNLSEQRLDAIKAQTTQDLSDTENLETFECLALAQDVPNSRNPVKYKRAYNCLTKLLEESPENSSLMAYLGILTIVGAVSNESYYQARSINPDIDETEGLEMIERAHAMSPQSSLTNYLLAEGYKFVGKFEASRKHAELAYIANPGSPVIIMSLSGRLASEGEFERSIALAEIGAERNPVLSRYLYRISFLRELMSDNHDGLIEQVANMQEFGDGYAYLYEFVAATLINDLETMERLRSQVSETAAKPGNEKRIIEFMSMHGNPDLQAKLQNIFVESGIFTDKDALALQK